MSITLWGVRQIMGEGQWRTREGELTTDPEKARAFVDWEEAERYVIDTCPGGLTNWRISLLPAHI